MSVEYSFNMNQPLRLLGTPLNFKQIHPNGIEQCRRGYKRSATPATLFKQ
jgi:hypothetical protein